MIFEKPTPMHEPGERRPTAGQQHRLGHELLEDLASRSADRHLDADLADALLQRRHLDVDVDDAAADQRQRRPRAGRSCRRRRPGCCSFFTRARDVVEAEVVLLAVVRLEHARELPWRRSPSRRGSGCGRSRGRRGGSCRPRSAGRRAWSGSATIRLRQRKMLLAALAEAEDPLPEDADDRAPACRRRGASWPTASPVGEEDARRPRVPRIATGAAMSRSCADEGAPLLDLVAVEREEVAADAADVALLVGVGRAHARPRVLCAARRRRPSSVSRSSPSLGVGACAGRGSPSAAPSARPRLTTADWLDVQLVEAAHPHVELHRSAGAAVGDREAAEHRGDAEHDAERLEDRARPRFSRISTQELRRRSRKAPLSASRRPLPAGGGFRAALDQPVVDLDLALRHGGDREVVGDDDDRVALAVELARRARAPRGRSSSRGRPVGSSASSSAGRLASARAIATRWRWPPESAAGRTFAFSGMPTFSSSSSARARRSLRETPA